MEWRMQLTEKNLKTRLLLAVFALVVVFALVHLVKILNKPPTLSADLIEWQGSPFLGSDIISKGNLNGIPIAVPSNYLYFPFEYLDKSIWEAPKPGDKPYSQRTYEDSVGGFSIYVHWPDMQPRHQKNNLIFLTKDENGGNDWLMVSVHSDYISIPRPPKTVDNGLARVLKGKIKYLENKLVNGGPWGKREKVQVRYEQRGQDKVTGLNWAIPVGPYTELFHTWNEALYWQGDKETVVTDLIECDIGKFSNPNSYQKCRHKFEFPGMKTYVILSYPRTWLSQWRELKAKSQTLLLGFKADKTMLEEKLQ